MPFFTNHYPQQKPDPLICPNQWRWYFSNSFFHKILLLQAQSPDLTEPVDDGVNFQFWLFFLHISHEWWYILSPHLFSIQKTWQIWGSDASYVAGDEVLKYCPSYSDIFTLFTILCRSRGVCVTFLHQFHQAWYSHSNFSIVDRPAQNTKDIEGKPPTDISTEVIFTNQ